MKKLIVPILLVLCMSCREKMQKAVSVQWINDTEFRVDVKHIGSYTGVFENGEWKEKEKTFEDGVPVINHYEL